MLGIRRYASNDLKDTAYEINHRDEVIASRGMRSARISVTFGGTIILRCKIHLHSSERVVGWTSEFIAKTADANLRERGLNEAALRRTLRVGALRNFCQYETQSQ